MSDPTRLVEGEEGPEKGLLRAWRARQPSEAARTGTLAAVGVGGAVGLASGGAAALPKAGVLSSSIVKWVAVTCGMAVAAGAASYEVQRSEDAPARKTVSPLEAPAREAVRPVPLPPSPPPPVPVAPPVVVTPAPLAPAIPSQAGAVVASPAKAPPPASSLDDEVRAVEQARRALRGGDPGAALDLLDAYDARFPAGALTEESSELRVEALYKSGKRTEADVLAARFLSAHPASPYARVVRALSGGATVPSP